MATTAQAKRDFATGNIRAFKIIREIDRRVFVELLYTAASGIGTDHLDDARTKQTRMFKTTDAAISALEQIGFNCNVIGS